MKLLLENFRKYLNEETLQCIPLDGWDGPPSGIVIWTHSTGMVNRSNFNQVIKDGFRVATSGGGSLSITFLEEGLNPGVAELKKSLKDRVKGDRYNLGSQVVLAGVDPKLHRDRGIDDEVINDARAGRIDPLGAVGSRNVRVLEEFPEGHKWHDNAWKMPGRFLLGLYDGDSDKICINPSFDGSTGTEYGERLHKNWLEYQKISAAPRAFDPDPEPALPPAVPSANSDAGDDFDVF